MPLLTAQQYIAKSIDQYPSLFMLSTYDDSKFAVLSHLFEAVGNGVKDFKGFRKLCAGKGDEPDMPPAHYYDGTPLFTGFTEVTTFGSVTIPQYSAKTFYGVPESQKDQYPSVVLWKTPRPSARPAPYPNFKVEYALVYELKNNLSKLDISWIEAAQWFYKECKNYFHGDCRDYHFAHPKPTDHQNLLAIQDFLKYVENQKKPGLSTQELHQNISEAYRHPYDGDPDHFLATKWLKERKRIMQYIDATLDLLAAAHASHPSQKPKKSPKIK